MQNIKDIEAAIEEAEEYWGELGWFSDEKIEGVDGVINGVEHVGGEGQGEYTHIVFRIDHDGTSRHFKKVGCRVSHSGTYWDGPFTEVKQQQKVVTVWE
jgi:hypothetical protein